MRDTFFLIFLSKRLSVSEVRSVLGACFPQASIEWFWDCISKRDILFDVEETTGDFLTQITFHDFNLSLLPEPVHPNLYLAARLANEFDCLALCDGSGFGDDDSPFWWLIYDGGKWQLARDSRKKDMLDVVREMPTPDWLPLPTRTLARSGAKRFCMPQTLQKPKTPAPSRKRTLASSIPRRPAAPRERRFHTEHRPLIPQPQPVRLSFALGGEVLLHSAQEQVVAWEVATGQQRYQCDGRFIGQSLDGQTFLTYCYGEKCGWDKLNEDDKFCGPTLFQGSEGHAWNAATGQEIPLEQIDPASYAIHDRYAISALHCYPPIKMVIHDLLGEYPPKTLSPKLTFLRAVELTNWAMIPHRRYLACAFYGGEFSYEVAYGHIINMKTGRTLARAAKSWLEADVCTFDASRFVLPAPLYFSVEHNLLISGDQNHFSVYSLSDQRRLREIRVSEGHGQALSFGGSVVAVHPQRQWFVAVNLEPLNVARGRYGIRLLNISANKDKGRVVQKLAETGKIVELAFHPQGRLLASLLANGEIHLWDIEIGEQTGAWSQ